MSAEKTGINLIGYLGSAVGLGEAARNTARVLETTGVPFVCADVEPPVPTGLESLTPSWAVVGRLADMPYPVNLFHLNPEKVLSDVLVWRGHAGIDLAHRVSAVVPFWELPRFPEHWRRACLRMDFVLAPTRFVEAAASDAVGDAGVEVLHYRQGIEPLAPIEPARVRWGIRPDVTAFFCGFDLYSDITRKNPWGAIDAFQRAFADRGDVQLLIKVNHAEKAAGESAMQLERLRSTAGADPRISLLTESLSRDDLLSLYASVDVVVSLHRSEGLGLVLMEAMALGKATIATGWSGNMDFMNDENSMLVPYDLVPVESVAIAAYQGTEGTQEWAQPRVEEAAAVMRLLADDPTLRTRLGGRARADIERLRAEQLRAPALHSLLEAAEKREWRSRAHATRMRKVGMDVAYFGARRLAARTLRAVHLKATLPPDVRPAAPLALR